MLLQRRGIRGYKGRSGSMDNWVENRPYRVTEFTVASKLLALVGLATFKSSKAEHIVH